MEDSGVFFCQPHHSFPSIRLNDKESIPRSPGKSSVHDFTKRFSEKMNITLSHLVSLAYDSNNVGCKGDTL